MLTRRLFGGAALGGALAGKKALTDALVKDALQRKDAVPGIAQGLAISKAPTLMPYHEALNKALGLPDIRERVREWLLENRRIEVTHIDIDILSKKSWSDSYKVLVMKERLFEEQVDTIIRIANPAHHSGPLESIINKFMYG